MKSCAVHLHLLCKQYFEIDPLLYNVQPVLRDVIRKIEYQTEIIEKLLRYNISSANLKQSRSAKHSVLKRYRELLLKFLCYEKSKL